MTRSPTIGHAGSSAPRRPTVTDTYNPDDEQPDDNQDDTGTDTEDDTEDDDTAG